MFSLGTIHRVLRLEVILEKKKLVIFHSFGSCYVSCPGISWSATGSSAFYLSFY